MNTNTKSDLGQTIVFHVLYLGQCGSGFSKKIERVIELKSTSSLDDLHSAIIYDAFNWDDPHMYAFHFDNIPYSQNRKKEYSCDPNSDIFGDEKPNSTKTRLKDLKLKKNQKFLFLFDFGDDHQFGIQVRGFGEISRDKKYPIITEQKGKAPKQY